MTSVIPAALIAAGFVFGHPASAGATQGHHKKAQASKTATATSGQSQAHKSSTAKKPAKTTKKSAAKTSSKTATKGHKARHVVHQDASGAVVAERITPEPYGPFQPVEAYDFPRPPCGEIDTVIEAHEHDADEEDSPEAEDVAEAIPDATTNAWARVARTVGSWLRPKSAQSTLRPEDVDLSDLLTAGVQIPVEGVDSSRLKDSFLNSRGKHRQHLAIDIGAPKGTPVLAAADGEILQTRREKRGGISLYQKDSTGNYLLFYCHLTRYAEGMKSGRRVRKGDVIAYVGRTGHVIGGPHLHFSITRLPEDDGNFKAGVAINPYLLFLAAVQ